MFCLSPIAFLSSFLVIFSPCPVFAGPWEPSYLTDDFGERVVGSIVTYSTKPVINTLVGIPALLAVSCERAGRGYRNEGIRYVNMILPNKPSIHDNTYSFTDNETQAIKLHVKVNGKRNVWNGGVDKWEDIGPYYITSVTRSVIGSYNSPMFPFTPRTKKLVVGNEGTPVTFDVSGWEDEIKKHCP
ncbi:MAG: hypothetical protein F4Z75_08215 [Synechococcus sp. SB0668_bin_15]|nr:hypothetical protein [Synechococcus sp. SB0668_bin_15]MYC49857.1 hypothetical protein [Synechococcus sp. SB0662_bin_14]